MPSKKKSTTKSTKKSSARKSASPKKKVKTKAKAKTQKALVCANGEQCFWVSDGKVLSNLVELKEAFDRMEENVFKYHVTKEKNDFANWVESVLDDSELAQALRKAKKPKTARTVVVRRLQLYSF